MADGQPADACPYARPFTVDFDDCPAYSPVRFVALDSLGNPLKPGWTCAHLTAALDQSERARFYGRCRIGDAARRAEWADVVGPDRLRAWDEWRKLSGHLVEDAIRDLIAANREALPGGVGGLVAASVEPLLQEFLGRIAHLFDAHADVLARLEFPRDAYLELLERWARFVVQTGGRAEWRTPAEVFERFPPAAQPLVDVEHWAATYRT